MNSKEQEFRITVEGPPLSVEQLENQLRKLASEAERSGVDMTVERIETEEPDFDGFK